MAQGNSVGASVATLAGRIALGCGHRGEVEPQLALVSDGVEIGVLSSDEL
jgi:hypothetical protein